MNTTNITIDPTCPDRAWYANAGIKAAFVIFYILAPLTFLITFLGHIFCLIAFRTQTKKEKAYIYQIFLTISDIVKSLVTFIYVVTFEWGSSPRDTNLAWPAYRACYPCMEFSSLFPIGLTNVAIIISQMLAVIMSADRVYALSKPFSYKNLNHHRLQISTAAVCIFVGIGANLFHCFRFDVKPIKDESGVVLSYQIVLNAKFASSVMGNILTQFRNIFDLLCLLALYTLNFSLLWLYRTRRKEGIKNFTNTGGQVRITAQEKRRRETEKTLAMLTITQSFSTTVMVSSTVLFYTVIFIKPSFYTCSGLLFAPLSVLSRQSMETVEMICIFYVSRHVRRVILKYLSFCKKSNVIDVTPMGPIGQRTPNTVSRRS